jgi:hypothetical protein
MSKHLKFFPSIGLQLFLIFGFIQLISRLLLIRLVKKRASPEVKKSKVAPAAAVEAVAQAVAEAALAVVAVLEVLAALRMRQMTNLKTSRY